MVRLTGNDTPGRKERTMTYSYENHVPSRAEIVIGMAADAIRRWRDRRELAKFVQGSPGEADRVARDSISTRRPSCKLLPVAAGRLSF